MRHDSSNNLFSSLTDAEPSDSQILSGECLPYYRITDAPSGIRSVRRLAISKGQPTMTTASPTLHRDEFPDYGTVKMPIPYGFADSSYHNDDCPSWYNEALHLKLWIDYEDVSLREPGRTRFALQHYIGEYEFEEEILATDDYNAILAAIAAACSHTGTVSG